MRKNLFSMKQKFVFMVASLLLLFVIATTVICGGVFTKEITAQSVEYASQMTETANRNVESYLKKLRLITYILQNNSLAKPILKKTTYQDDSERLTDMKTMQLLLKAVMTGAEYMQNIYVYTETGTDFSAGGAYTKLDEELLKKYQELAENQDVVFGVQQARDQYDYPKMILTKKLSLGKGAADAWVVMVVNCRGIYGIYNETERYDSALVIWDEQNNREIYKNNLEKLELETLNLNTLNLNTPIDPNMLSKLSREKDKAIVKLGETKVLLMKQKSQVTGWQSLVLIPYRQIYSQHKKLLFMNVILLILFSLTAVVLSVLMAKRFMKNIELLADAVGRVQKDSLSLDVRISSGDEAEVLYHRFEEMIYRIGAQIEEIKQKEKEKRILALQVLQAQINPHFLYNSLHTIKWMGQMQGADSIVDAVNALSSIMQVNMSKKNYMTFQEELHYLNQYVCMQEFKKAARIRFVCKIEEELKQCYLLKMLLQPLVENSLKHGGIMEREDGYISVSVYRENEAVLIDVEDNGSGIDETQSRDIMANLQNGEGIGLFNIQKRIQLHYGDSYGVSITGEKGIYTCVSLKIPERRQAGEEDD